MLSLVGREARRSILLVEPEPYRELQAARPLLESAGFRVTWAATFDDAKRLLQSHPPDVLVTELKLGPYNGLHLVLRSRFEHPHMGIVVMSNFADLGLEAEASRQNAAFLVRPFGEIELLDAVHRSLPSGDTAVAAVEPVSP